jgi:gliding motility-associated-like protein
MKNTLKTLLCSVVLFHAFDLRAQKDTEFWFVAPEISQGNSGTNYDRPVGFRVSTYDSPAQVTLSQPANPAFLPQTLALPANTSGFFFLPNVDDFENKPPNTVLNFGFLISATASITAYYEILGDCLCNPEIFSLKGKNALGTDFYVPLQTILDNSNLHFPPPHAAFDIVATEDNTTVTINPTQPIVGHPAGAGFSITLQRGQSWSGEAAGQTAAEHPAGTRVSADKPIAITIKDDLLDGSVFGGFCRDLIGDQIIPLEKTGTQYVVQKGFITGTEKVFILGTAPNTSIKINGVVAGTVNAGQTYVADISGSRYFIEASAPVYVLQLTGIGCEVASNVLPPLDCNGSLSVRFVRPTDEGFWLYLATRSGNEDGFLLNGTPGLIPASAFSSVPGSGGQYVSAVIPYTILDIGTQVSSLVSNTEGVFQMGFLNGQEFATGARFGFFSDFGAIVNDFVTLEKCKNDTIRFNGITIPEAGIYYDTLPGTAGCDTLLEIMVTDVQYISDTRQFVFCEGDTLQIYGNNITQSGTYTDTINSTTGCDTILTIVAQTGPYALLNQNIEFCTGDTVLFRGFSIFSPGTFTDTLGGTGGCDTILTIKATALPLPEKINTVILCAGEWVEIDGVIYQQAGVVTDTVDGGNACDTVMTYLIDGSQIAITLEDSVYVLAGLFTVLSPEIISVHSTQSAWFPPDGLDAPDKPAPTALPASTQEYFLKVTDELGCTATDSIVVVVREINCANSTYVPNIFSPDDDGQNDVFTVFADEECIINVRLLRVYDRWGSLVFEKHDFQANDYSQGWNGSFRNQPATPGVYVYYLEVENYLGNIEKFSGDVTLLK